MRKAQFTKHQIITILKSVETRRTVKDVCHEATITSMEYLRFASTESVFGLLLASIRYQEFLCLNG